MKCYVFIHLKIQNKVKTFTETVFIVEHMMVESTMLNDINDHIVRLLSILFSLLIIYFLLIEFLEHF